MRILFTGAQGTGKTTLIERFEELQPSLYKIKGVTRKVLKQNDFKPNENSTDECQNAIFNAKRKELERSGSFMSERSLIDVFAYTSYQYRRGKCSYKELANEMSNLTEYIRSHKDDVYVFFPVEFELKDDGVRSVDKEYQKEISDIIWETINALDVHYFVVTGTIDERVKMLNTIMYYCR